MRKEGREGGMRQGGIREVGVEEGKKKRRKKGCTCLENSWFGEQMAK